MGFGPFIAALGAGARSIEETNDRNRKRKLEELRLEDLIQERRDRRSDREQTRAVRDANLREDGYVPAASRVRDTTIKGQTLDAIINATSDGPRLTMGTPDFTPRRYSAPVGGYSFDALSPAARTRTANARRAERLADAESPSRQTSFTERNTEAIQDRIEELSRAGKPLAEANRIARMEAGQSVSSGRTLDRILSESPIARDNRRAADRDRLALNSTSRELTNLKKEIGKYPSAADSASGRVARVGMLQARRDSLQGEFDKHSSAANAATLGSPAGPSGPRTAQRSDSTSLQQAMRRELVEARNAYDAALAQGMDSTSARALYSQVVEAIRAKYGAQ